MRLACGCQPAVVCGSRPEAPFAISCDETIAGIGLDEAKMARSFNKHLQRNLGNRGGGAAHTRDESSIELRTYYLLERQHSEQTTA